MKGLAKQIFQQDLNNLNELKKCAEAGNNINIEEHGGFMTNRQTGKQIRIYEMDGVCYLKIKVHDPIIACDEDPSENELSPPPKPSGFAGRGR